MKRYKEDKTPHDLFLIILVVIIVVLAAVLVIVIVIVKKRLKEVQVVKIAKR